jgi:hypothetical protein
MKTFALLAALLAAMLAPARLQASTGPLNEITNIHTENCTQTGCDVVWTTVHASTSQVAIARDTQYEVDRLVPAVTDPALVTSHRVRVENIWWWSPNSVAYYYAIARQANGTLATAPGPQTPDQRNPLLPMKLLPTDQGGPTVFAFNLIGPFEIFAGADMYTQMTAVMTSGPIPDAGSGGGTVYIENQGGYNNGSDCALSWVPSPGPNIRPGNPQAMSCHWICGYSGPGDDARDQSKDDKTGLGICYNGKTSKDMNLRVRATDGLLPGKYKLSGSVLVNGKRFTYAHEFVALPKPTAADWIHIAQDFPPIPGDDQWQANFLALSESWCKDRDDRNAGGDVLNLFGPGYEQTTGFYDGGRTYENGLTEFGTDATKARWQHCALVLLQPYADYLRVNSGQINQYSEFAWGMADNYERTGSPSMKQGVLAIAHNSSSVHYGSVEPGRLRENSYHAETAMAAYAIGDTLNPRLGRKIDHVIGNLLMVADQGFEAHPFMQGIGLQTLIHWWDLSGHTDYRVFPVAKKVLDAMWRDSYEPTWHYMDYDRYRVPQYVNDLRWTTLNPMAALGYHWYYLWTGDKTALARGDELVLHAFDSPNYKFAGKEYSQAFWFGFDSRRYRKGINVSTVDKSYNPYTGAWPDTNPPIIYNGNCDRLFNGCKPGTVTSTTFLATWNTYEGATGQVLYGTTSAMGSNTPVNSTMLLSHFFQLTALQPATLYYVAYQSVDAAGNVAQTPTFTFTTPGTINK